MWRLSLFVVGFPGMIESLGPRVKDMYIQKNVSRKEMFCKPRMVLETRVTNPNLSRRFTNPQAQQFGSRR